jgi:hypothetical protein
MLRVRSNDHAVFFATACEEIKCPLWNADWARPELSVVPVRNSERAVRPGSADACEAISYLHIVSRTCEGITQKLTLSIWFPTVGQIPGLCAAYARGPHELAQLIGPS